MKRYIKNKVYDTGTAHMVGRADNGEDPTSFRYVEETLFRKKTGEYFLHGFGGAATVYAEPTGSGSWGAGETIQPMTNDAARAWAEENLSADEVEAEWGTKPEAERSPVNVWVSAQAKRNLMDEAARTGENQTDIIERLLLGL